VQLNDRSRYAIAQCSFVAAGLDEIEDPDERLSPYEDFCDVVVGASLFSYYLLWWRRPLTPAKDLVIFPLFVVLCSCLMTAPDGESRCGAKGKLPEFISSGSLDMRWRTLYSARLA
jgi:hypothetical protein